MTDVASGLARDASAIVLFVPSVIGAAISILVGWLIAYIVDRLLTATLTKGGFDQLAARTGMIEDFERVGIRVRPSRLIGRLAFWLILAAALVQAINVLQLAEISRSLGAFIAFLPHVVIAVIIVLVGIIIGDMVGRGAAGAMSRSGIAYHDVAGGFVRSAIIVVAALMALQQLTIESEFFFEIFLAAFGALALAFAIACGLGARHVAENAIAGRAIEQRFALGDRVAVDGRKGVVERIDSLSTVLRTADGRRIVLPNSVLANSIVEIDDGPITTSSAT